MSAKKIKRLSGINNFAQRAITGAVAGGLFFGLYFLSPILFVLLLFVILDTIMIFEWPKLSYYKKNSFLYWLGALFYPILPFGALIYLALYHDGLYPVLAAITVDTGSYFCGKLFGNKKLAPTISPGKTWAGLIGGALSLALFNGWYLSETINNMLLINRYHYSQTLYQSLAIILATSAVLLFAVLGDLYVSFLKRRAGVKDTGTLLPGHGGLLDRFDSILGVALLIGALRLFIWFL